MTDTASFTPLSESPEYQKRLAELMVEVQECGVAEGELVVPETYIPPRESVPVTSASSEGMRVDDVSIPEHIKRNYKNEKWEHRIVAFLKAQGYSNKEIAERTGYTTASVSNIIQTPWAKQLIMEEINRSGRTAVDVLLQSTVVDNIEFLASTVNNDKAQTRDRISAANSLLDRALGKPTQTIAHKEAPNLDSLTDAELAAIAAKGARQN
jgi:hypothetical protein